MPRGTRSALGRLVTDPLAPALTMAVVALVAVGVSAPTLAWAGLGGLAGYTLSGSV